LRSSDLALAALATEQAGHDPIIFSKDNFKSPMFGAMYLHEAIPGLNDPLVPDFEIDVIKVGSREGYAYNVYRNREAPCSWDVISPGPTPAWDLAAAYSKLWERYLPNIREYQIGPSDMGVIANNYPVVFSSIPAPAICNKQHEFLSQDIWVIHGPHINPIEGVNDGNMMYYNGVPWDGSFAAMTDDYTSNDGHGYGPTYMRGHDWYRFSQINGYQAWEYSRPETVAEDNPRTLSTGKKPLATTCHCWEQYPSFYRIGRFGTWRKGVLTHHAYREAQEVLRAL
jgi:hypothetical protein